MASGEMQEIVVSSAPGRAGFIGNPTDMYGGTVISCSTEERATVRLEPWDELVFETPRERVEEYIKLISDEMTGAIKLDVPLKVDINIGSSWLSDK